MSGFSFTGRGQALRVHPGYIAANWYQPIVGASVVAGSAASANTIALMPFVLTRPIKIQALGVRITTLAAGGHSQCAIYAHNPATGRPTGTAIVSTGDIANDAAGAFSAAVAAQATLQPGIYWMAVNQDNATVVYQTLTSGFAQMSALMGSATLANVASAAGTALLVVTVSQAYGTWPDLTSATFTEVVAANRSAVVLMQAA